MVDHYILDASNNELTVTNLFGSNSPTHTLGAIPLGTVGGSATGELATKVIIVGGTSGAIVLGAGTAAIGSTTTSGAVTDRSGTITSGGTAQTLAAALATRRYFLFQNNSDIDMWINFGATAVASQPSIKILAGGSYENPAHFCPNALISVIGATTGKTFTAKEA